MPKILPPELIDLKNNSLIEDVLAPSLGQRIGAVVGDAQRVADAVISAAGLLQSQDGLAIASGMAGVIKAFTGWLRGQIEGDSVTERENIAAAQGVFCGPPSPRWMWRQAVGGPPASSARTKMGLKWPSTRVLGQWAPGACYVFPRIGWDVVRRSFVRTDGANVFDKGQPDLKWTAADEALANCITRIADYWEGRGCGYNPGERIQISAGTWPYTSGRQVMSWSGLASVDLAGHYFALHTPSAIHVATDARPVHAIFDHWRSLVLAKLPPLVQVGQSDEGVYLDADGSVHVQGPPLQTVYLDVGGLQWASTAQAIEYVTASFLGFFNLREAVLRDWPYLAPSAKAAGLKSSDPAIKARAAGGPYKPAADPSTWTPPNSGPKGIAGTGATAGAVALGTVALGSLALLARRGR